MSPDGGDTLAMPGATVKATPLLARPRTVTTTGPLAAAAGSNARILDVLHDVTAAAVPLNATVLELCVAPKFAPAIVTAVPARPLVGDTDETIGVWIGSGATIRES